MNDSYANSDRHKKPNYGTLIAVSFLIVMAMFLCYSSGCGIFQYLGPTKESNARLTCKYIAMACKAYRNHPESKGQYPEKLSDLLHPPFGGKPFLESDGRALIDPWGKPVQFEIVDDPNDTANKIPVVFTIDPQGRRIAWPREYGDI